MIGHTTEYEEVLRGDGTPEVIEIDLYESDGTTLIKNLDVVDDSVRVGKNRPATFSFEMTEMDDEVIEGNIVNIKQGYATPAGDELFSQGWFIITNIDPTVSEEINVIISGMDFTEKINGSKFRQTTKFEDTPSETTRAISSNTVTSNIAVGDQIQHQGEVKSLKGYATLAGIRTEVANELASNAQYVVNNSTSDKFSFRYTDQTMQKLEVVAKIDLKTTETLSSMTPVLTAGTATELKTSTNGTNWTSHPVSGFSSNTDVRYIEMTVLVYPSAGVATITIDELQCVTANAFPGSNAYDADANISTGWRPSKIDLDREIVFNLGSAVSFNDIVLYWGINYLDLWNRVKYKIYYLSGSNWLELVDQTALSVTDYVEHVVNATTAQYIKVKVTGAAGIVCLRHVAFKSITAVNPYSYLFQTIAEEAGIAKFKITPTLMYKANYLKRRGEERKPALDELAEAIGWEWFFDSDNYLVFRPQSLYMDPTNPAWTYEVGTENIERFAPRLSSQDVKNVVLVISDLPEATLSAIVENNDLYDPASIQQIGEKVADPIENNFLKTQDEVNYVARMELTRQNRFRHPVTIEGMANPALEVGDIIAGKEADFTGIDTVYRVESISISGIEMTVEAIEL